jgi:hypothetical protein
MSGKRGKKSGSVRDRVPGLRKQSSNDTQIAGGTTMVVAPSADQKTEITQEKPEQKKIPASVADYLAAQLHEAQGNIVDLRSNSISLRQALLQKDQIILNLEKKIFAMEAQEVEKLKIQLREDHGLTFGRTLKKDDETGEVFWLETEEATG